ncbi:MAG: NAD(P)-dependent oxidoreductase [Gammaproteobacteria bacterium]|nr:NAD(P)-dependent oxidoreductase [Gammaproteobacteria bacterium]
MLKDQKVLVTGATGQVARPIAEQLNANNEVWAAARFSDPEAKAELEAQGINTVFFSIGEEDLSQLPNVDYVIHCGCNTDPKTPEDGMRQNAEGTGFLMQRYRGVKGFFHMSSSSVYGLTEDPSTVVSETDQLGGYASYSPHYAMSKQSTEAVVRFQARALKLPTIIARLDVAYGTRGHGGAPLALVEFMKRGIPYYRAENGDSYCSPIHEDDIVEQVQGLLEHAAVPAAIVNLGGDEVVTVEEMIATIESLTDLSMTVEVRELATWQMTVLDNTRRKEMAGPCKVSWKDGIRRALETRYPDLLQG